MPDRIPERALILPALYFIRRNMPEPTSTSELIERLSLLFRPSGEDDELLAGRGDNKFSQKVRNLKSHRATNMMDKYTSLTGDGRYLLTPAGQRHVEENLDDLERLFSCDFDAPAVAGALSTMEAAGRSGRRVTLLDENCVVSEGRLTTRASDVRERSRKLRAAAIEHYRNADGKLRCAVCGFCFEDRYGELGRDFIEIHHEEPICRLSDEGDSSFLSHALSKVKPLCSNCHRMVHRHPNSPLPLSTLKSLLTP